MNNELVKIYTMARILGVSISWLRQETDSGKIPHLVAGDYILYSPDAVKTALANLAANSGANLNNQQSQPVNQSISLGA